MASPAQPGEVVILYGTGFGQTRPEILSGIVVASPAPLTHPVTVFVGGMRANVQWSGMIGAGLWQLNVTIPENLPDGDARVIAEIGGIRSQEVLISIQRL